MELYKICMGRELVKSCIICRGYIKCEKLEVSMGSGKGEAIRNFGKIIPGIVGS